MSATKFLDNINGNEHQLINWILHNVDADFVGMDLITGRMWYNVIDNLIKYYDGLDTLTVASVEYIDSLANDTDIDLGQPYKILARQGDEWYGVDSSDIGTGGDIIEVADYATFAALAGNDHNKTYLVTDASDSNTIHSSSTWGIYKFIDGNPSLIALGEPNIQIDDTDRSIKIRFSDSTFKIWVEAHHGDTSHSIAIEKI